MSMIEKLLLQIFDRKQLIVDQVKHQAELYDQQLASKLLIRGLKPPPWLLNPRLSNPQDLNEEELVKGILRCPQSLVSYPSNHCALYNHLVATAGTNEFPNGFLPENFGIRNDYEARVRSTILPSSHVDGVGCANSSYEVINRSKILPQNLVDHVEHGNSYIEVGDRPTIVPQPPDEDNRSSSNGSEAGDRSSMLPQSPVYHVGCADGGFETDVMSRAVPQNPVNDFNCSCNSPEISAGSPPNQIDAEIPSVYDAGCVDRGFKSGDMSKVVSQKPVNGVSDGFNSPEIRANSPLDWVDAQMPAVDQLYPKPHQSLERIQRSKSRQRALELRNSAKASSKSCSNKANNISVGFGGILGSIIDLQLPNHVSESLERARFSNITNGEWEVTEGMKENTQSKEQPNMVAENANVDYSGIMESRLNLDLPSCASDPLACARVSNVTTDKCEVAEGIIQFCPSKEQCNNTCFSCITGSSNFEKIDSVDLNGTLATTVYLEQPNYIRDSLDCVRISNVINDKSDVTEKIIEDSQPKVSRHANVGSSGILASINDLEQPNPVSESLECGRIFNLETEGIIEDGQIMEQCSNNNASRTIGSTMVAKDLCNDFSGILEPKIGFQQPKHIHESLECSRVYIPNGESEVREGILEPRIDLQQPKHVSESLECAGLFNITSDKIEVREGMIEPNQSKEQCNSAYAGSMERSKDCQQFNYINDCLKRDHFSITSGGSCAMLPQSVGKSECSESADYSVNDVVGSAIFSVGCVSFGDFEARSFPAFVDKSNSNIKVQKMNSAIAPIDNVKEIAPCLSGICNSTDKDIACSKPSPVQSAKNSIQPGKSSCSSTNVSSPHCKRRKIEPVISNPFVASLDQKLRQYQNAYVDINNGFSNSTIENSEAFQIVEHISPSELGSSQMNFSEKPDLEIHQNVTCHMMEGCASSLKLQEEGGCNLMTTDSSVNVPFPFEDTKLRLSSSSSFSKLASGDNQGSLVESLGLADAVSFHNVGKHYTVDGKLDFLHSEDQFHLGETEVLNTAERNIVGKESYISEDALSAHSKDPKLGCFCSSNFNKQASGRVEMADPASIHGVGKHCTVDEKSYFLHLKGQLNLRDTEVLNNAERNIEGRESCTSEDGSSSCSEDPRLGFSCSSSFSRQASGEHQSCLVEQLEDAAGIHHIFENGLSSHHSVWCPIEKKNDLFSDNEIMPVFEGFIMAEENPIPCTAVDRICFDELDLPNCAIEHVNVLEQLCRSANMRTPFPQFANAYKSHNTPHLQKSVPIEILEWKDRKSFLLVDSDSGKKLKTCYTDCKSFPSVPHAAAIRTYTSPIGKLWEGVKFKFDSGSGSSEKQETLTCFPIIEEENRNTDEAVEAKHEVPVEIKDDCPKPPPLVSETRMCANRVSLESVKTEMEFIYGHDEVRQMPGNPCTANRRYTREIKENHCLSVGATGIKRVSESLQSRVGKEKLLEKTNMRNKGPSLLDTVSKHSNVMSNKNQAAAVFIGKRDVKVKALEAAEAAKRLEEKRENERKMKREAMKLQRAKLEKKRLLGGMKKSKEEERRKIGADLSTKKRHREDEEGKYKEKKRKHLEGAKRPQREDKEKLHPDKEQSRILDRRLHEMKKSESEPEQLGNVENESKEDAFWGRPDTELAGRFSICDDTTKENSMIENCDGIMDCSDIGKVRNTSDFQNDCSTSTIGREESYELSPYQGSDDDDEEEDGGTPNGKFIPSWASKSSLAQIVLSQQNVDADIIFRPQCSCHTDEAVLPRKQTC